MIYVYYIHCLAHIRVPLACNNQQKYFNFASAPPPTPPSFQRGLKYKDFYVDTKFYENLVLLCTLYCHICIIYVQYIIYVYML